MQGNARRSRCRPRPHSLRRRRRSAPGKPPTRRKGSRSLAGCDTSARHCTAGNHRRNQCLSLQRWAARQCKWTRAGLARRTRSWEMSRLRSSTPRARTQPTGKSGTPANALRQASLAGRVCQPSRLAAQSVLVDHGGVTGVGALQSGPRGDAVGVGGDRGARLEHLHAQHVA